MSNCLLPAALFIPPKFCINTSLHACLINAFLDLPSPLLPNVLSFNTLPSISLRLKMSLRRDVLLFRIISRRLFETCSCVTFSAQLLPVIHFLLFLDSSTLQILLSASHNLCSMSTFWSYIMLTFGGSPHPISLCLFFVFQT